MGLLLKSVILDDFRNIENREISFSDEMTVLVGKNATGKTNTIEALQLLTRGKSFRNPRSAHLVRDGADAARAVGRLEGDGRIIDVEVRVTPEKRTFLKNGKACQASALEGTLLSVLFNPDDLSFVKRGASYRRDELDGFGSQANKGYRKVHSAFHRGIEQRNKLLKQENPDMVLLDAWDDYIAKGGAKLLSHRLGLFSKLRRHIEAIYEEISDGETLECSYVSSLGDDVEGMSREKLANVYLDKLQMGRQDDLRRQQTLTGPQRDDLEFRICGRDARAFGSQGQQRTIVLAWKMAEVNLATELLNEKPLLLLDDVMSELDEQRRAAILKFATGDIQTVITTTNLGYFTDDFLGGAKVVSYG